MGGGIANANGRKVNYRMMTIILIRHGESEANEKNMFAGYSDQELTANKDRQRTSRDQWRRMGRGSVQRAKLTICRIFRGSPMHPYLLLSVTTGGNLLK